MKSVALALAIAVSVVGLSACRTNQLYIYANDAMTMQVVDAPVPGVRPVVASLRQDPNDPKSTTFDVLEDVVAAGVQKKLEDFAPVQRVSPKVTTRVAEGVPTYLRNTTVGDTDPKARLEISVRSYGVDTNGPDVSAFMSVSARMVHFAVGDTIWETTEWVRVPVRTVPGIIAIGPGGDLVSLSVLQGFSDEQWRAILDQLVVSSADAVLARMRNDTVAN
jgi:hypothetical protein